MNYKFFTNKKCKYYPCHNIKKINCLFCFCPLYAFNKCGGIFKIEKEMKNCSSCKLPHLKTGYKYVIEFLKNNKIIIHP